MDQVVRVDQVPGDDPEFARLVQALDEMLAVLNGEQNAFYAPKNLLKDDTTCFLARWDGEAVGCGAVRPDHGHGCEVKRMFVLPEARSRGVGEAIIKAIEEHARLAGASRLILETSPRLEPAVRLYSRNGFSPCAAYPPYEDCPDSICMEKLV